ncbi:IS4 family transposase, partial [Megasphaera sp. BL7]
GEIKIGFQREGHIVFVHGKGHRKTPLQKAIEKAKDFLHKTKEYAVQLHYCGDRNSYAKTDIDATFMHLKEDAMKNGQVKPAYNVQYSVDAGFVTWVTVGPQTSDCTTLLPFLEDFRKHFPFQYTRIIADSGYESEENYTKLAEQGYDAYIKPSDHEQRKKTPFQKRYWQIPEYGL